MSAIARSSWSFILCLCVAVAPVRTQAQCSRYLERQIQAEVTQHYGWWRWWSRHRLAHQIRREIEQRCPDVSTCSTTQVEQAIARAVQREMDLASSRITPRAWILFLGALAANGLAIPLALAKVPEDVRPYVGYFLVGFGGQILGALSGLVMNRLYSSAYRWSAQGTGPENPTGDPIMREYLRGLWTRMQGTLTSLEREARWNADTLDSLVSIKLLASFALFQSGAHKSSVSMTVNAIRVYIERHPDFSVADPELADGFQGLLSFASKNYRDAVFTELMSNPKLAAKAPEIQSLLDQWMPWTRQNNPSIPQ